MKMSEISPSAHPVVLVVAPPGYYRKSLVALIKTIPDFQNILVAPDLPQADSLPETSRPDYILLASPARRSPGASLPAAVDRMRRRWPRARLVLLSDAGDHSTASNLPRADDRLHSNASAGDLVALFRRHPLSKSTP
jgi:DNA-binding NarL/FixJ family response regulator